MPAISALRSMRRYWQTVYMNVPVLPSGKVNSAVPTVIPVAPRGFPAAGMARCELRQCTGLSGDHKPTGQLPARGKSDGGRREHQHDLETIVRLHVYLGLRTGLTGDLVWPSVSAAS
jgi:hypothetical protein